MVYRRRRGQRRGLLSFSPSVSFLTTALMLLSGRHAFGVRSDRLLAPSPRQGKPARKFFSGIRPASDGRKQHPGAVSGQDTKHVPSSTPTKRARAAGFSPRGAAWAKHLWHGRQSPCSHTGGTPVPQTIILADLAGSRHAKRVPKKGGVGSHLGIPGAPRRGKKPCLIQLLKSAEVQRALLWMIAPYLIRRGWAMGSPFVATRPSSERHSTQAAHQEKAKVTVFFWRPPNGEPRGEADTRVLRWGGSPACEMYP